MDWTDRIRQVRIMLVVVAIVIAVASLVVSHFLIADLSKEERIKMEVWAQALHTLNNANENTDVSLVLSVIRANNSIPVIVVDSAGNVMDYRNIEVEGNNYSDSILFLSSEANRMIRSGRAIKILLPPSDNGDDFQMVCYDDSLMLRRLATYPYVQLGIVFIFFVVAIIALLSSKRAEQNKVWVGLSKETAHQLGTPISSLMGWMEMLKDNYPEDDIVSEMANDVKRLEMITERFSKIGSKPEAKPYDIIMVVDRVVEYIDHRTSSDVSLYFDKPLHPVVVSINASLFEWVIENLCKNAVDAMAGKGSIFLNIIEEEAMVAVEVKDTGKGIRHKNLKNVFKPGFTTKKRGWGLGLSLARRIVEDYHKGKIFVKESRLGMGTTFRIELKQ
ncbi:MAG: HAMP domain-containing sensor histidine kinase [Prevotellaceae bacterium]|nr:HAMP domain-containing sensor histidine kinase [Prevotellaceae bacterium]